MKPIIVQKFGSSVLPDINAIDHVIKAIQNTVSQGNQVIAIVSAIGETTNQLLNTLKHYQHRSEHAVANYLSVGEIQSASLVTLAAKQAGLHAELITPHQIQLNTVGKETNADPVSLNTDIIHQALQTHDVLILPGFFGVNAHGQTTLLGRGGSDLSALFVAASLKAKLCQLYKDVDGVYDSDPAVYPEATRYEILNWHDALQLPGGIIQHKAVAFAEQHQVLFAVRAIGADYETLICAQPSQLAEVIS